MKKLVRHLIFLSLLIIFSYCSKENSTQTDSVVDNSIEEVSSTPSIILTNPLRGIILKEGTMGDMVINVNGEACDDINPIEKVILNNTSLMLAGTGDCKTFSSDLNSSWGLNIIDGSAKNDFGDEVSIVQSYIRSPEYFPAPGNTDLIENARRVRLGPEVLDDNDRSDEDDFASLIKIVLENSDFDSNISNVLIPEMCHSSVLGLCVFEAGVYKDGPFNLGEVTVNNVLALDGGLVKVNLSIGVTSLPIRIVGRASDVTFDTRGFASVEYINVEAIYNVVFDGNAVLVSLESNNTTVSNFSFGDFSGLDGAIINIISDLFSSSINSIMQDNIDDGLMVGLELFGSNLEQMLNDFNLEPSIIVPAPVDVELIVESSIDHLEVGTDFIDLGLEIKVEPTTYKKDATQLVYGSIIGSSSLPTFEDMNSSIGLGNKNDFINQFLWAVWAGGGFDIENGNSNLISDLLSSNSLNAIIASIETKVPPVLMSVGAAGSQVEIAIGDILIKAKINPMLLGLTESNIDVDISIYASLILTGVFELDSETGKMKFVLTTEPDTHIQIQDYIRTPDGIDLESKLGFFTNELLKLLINASISSVELPTIPIDGLTGIEPGTVWALDNGTIEHASGYINFVGEIGVEIE